VDLAPLVILINRISSPQKFVQIMNSTSVKLASHL